jgi:hypothetical protein
MAAVGKDPFGDDAISILPLRLGAERPIRRARSRIPSGGFRRNRVRASSTSERC